MTRCSKPIIGARSTRALTSKQCKLWEASVNVDRSFPKQAKFHRIGTDHHRVER